jgi:hypothetical protein
MATGEGPPFGQWGNLYLASLPDLPLDALARHEAVISWEAAGMMAGPQDQVIRLGDDDGFFIPFKVRHIFLSQSVPMFNSIFIFDRLRQ